MLQRQYIDVNSEVDNVTTALQRGRTAKVSHADFIQYIHLLNPTVTRRCEAKKDKMNT